MEDGRFTHISTNTTTTVHATKANLLSVSINTKGASSNVATVYNGPVASADVVAVIDTTDSVGTLEYGVRCPDGIYVVTATGTAADLTINWN